MPRSVVDMCFHPPIYDQLAFVSGFLGSQGLSAQDTIEGVRFTQKWPYAQQEPAS